jgi:hypothetical protein
MESAQTPPHGQSGIGAISYNSYVVLFGGLLTKNCVTTNSTAEEASKLDAKSGVEDGATDHLLQEQDAHDDETRPGLEISRSGLTSNVCRPAATRAYMRSSKCSERWPRHSAFLPSAQRDRDPDGASASTPDTSCQY